MADAFSQLLGIVNADKEIKAGEPIPKTEPTTRLNPDSVVDIVRNPEVVTADSVKAWIPHLKKTEKNSMGKLVDVLNGYEKPHVYKAISQEDARKAKSNNSLDKLIAELGGAPIGPEVAVEKDYEGTSAMQKIGEALSSPTARNIFAALAIDEHLMVSGLEKTLNAMGAQYREKEHIGDYHWGNFIKESGLPDNGYTTALGLGMSIFLSPSTYLTFGTSKTRLLADIPKALGGLSVTKHGARVLNTVAKTEGDRVVQQAVNRINRKLSKAGEELIEKLPAHAENAIRQKVKVNTHKEFLKQFGPHSSIMSKINSSKQLKVAIKDLGDKKVLDDIIEFGGIKWESPKTIFGLVDNPVAGGKQFKILTDSPLRGGDVYMFGQKVMHGEEVAHISAKLGIPKTMEWLGKSPIGKGAKATKDYLGEHLILNYGVPKQLVKTFRTIGDNDALVKEATKVYGKDAVDNARFLAVVEDAIDAGEGIKSAAFRRADEFFGDLTKQERIEFSEVAIEASTKEKKILVKAPSGNPKIQSKLDEWFGQGDFKGKQSIAQELAEKSKLIDGDPRLLQNWYPGIMHYLGLEDLKFNRVLGDTERKFLTERMGNDFVQGYTRNPVQAFSVRLAQIGYADLQEKVFQRVKDLNLGRDIGVEKLKTSELFKKGYKPISTPMWTKLKNLDNAPEGVVPSGRGLHMVKGDFADHFNKQMKGKGLPKFLQPFNFVTNLWKGTVTRGFPAFHARNFQSNIVMNGMRIGGHALSIPKNIKALQTITREVNPFRAMRVSNKINIGRLWFGDYKITNPNFVTTPANKFLEMAENAYDVITGLNKNKEWVSEIGERMSAISLLEEAQNLGLHKAGQFVEDIGGTHLSLPGQNAYSYFLNRFLNPLSKDLIFNAVGGKFGRLVEDQARMVNYITWRQRGLSPKMAFQEVNEALFDYGAITDFEKIARVFIPFYTFGRKNIENHIKVFAHRPGAITSQLKVFRDLGPTGDEYREQFPEWAARKFGLKVGEFLVTGYGVPMEDIVELTNDPGQQTILRTAPWLRYAMEKTFQKDVFTNRELQAVNNANEFKLALDLHRREDLPDFVRAPFTKIVNWLELKRDPSNKKKIIGNPDKLHMLRSGFTSRWQSIVGQATKEDQEMWVTGVRFLTGHMVIEPDASQKRAIEKSMTIKEIRDEALKNNIARPLGMFFVGGRKVDRDLANYYIKEALRGGSVKRQRKLRERFKEKAEQINRRSLGK